ncbi:hypothetical protein DFH06DRAFT_1296957 [Mycena polygramma]|nr:hypothetical protein DFH06DRAFT_1296957 [Mycena polygramma]
MTFLCTHGSLLRITAAPWMSAWLGKYAIPGGATITVSRLHAIHTRRVKLLFRLGGCGDVISPVHHGGGVVKHFGSISAHKLGQAFYFALNLVGAKEASDYMERQWKVTTADLEQTEERKGIEKRIGTYPTATDAASDDEWPIPKRISNYRRHIAVGTYAASGIPRKPVAAVLHQQEGSLERENQAPPKRDVLVQHEPANTCTTPATGPESYTDTTRHDYTRRYDHARWRHPPPDFDLTDARARHHDIGPEFFRNIRTLGRRNSRSERNLGRGINTYIAVKGTHERHQDSRTRSTWLLLLSQRLPAVRAIFFPGCDNDWLMTRSCPQWCTSKTTNSFLSCELLIWLSKPTQFVDADASPLALCVLWTIKLLFSRIASAFPILATDESHRSAEGGFKRRASVESHRSVEGGFKRICRVPTPLLDACHIGGWRQLVAHRLSPNTIVGRRFYPAHPASSAAHLSSPNTIVGCLPHRRMAAARRASVESQHHRWKAVLSRASGFKRRASVESQHHRWMPATSADGGSSSRIGGSIPCIRLQAPRICRVPTPSLDACHIGGWRQLVAHRLSPNTIVGRRFYPAHPASSAAHRLSPNTLSLSLDARHIGGGPHLVTHRLSPNTVLSLDARHIGGGLHLVTHRIRIG